jgi:hypothetical protein
MKQYKKPMKLWLGRTLATDESFSNYQIAVRKKDWTDMDGFDASFIAAFCGEEFERVTGVRLEKGEVVKVSLVVHGLSTGAFVDES